MKLIRSLLACILVLSMLLLVSCSEDNTVNSTENSTAENNTSSSSENISESANGSSSDNNVENDGNYADEGELKLRIFKMGKSDAYLFRTSSKTILIDCGDVDDAQEILDYFTEKSIEKIDYLLLTHFDKKSVGGAATLVSTLDIGIIYEPDYEKSNTAYLEYASALSQKGITAKKTNSVITFEVDGTSFIITPCEKSYYADDDNYCSTISVKHGDNSFLFVGDAKSERIDEIIKQENIQHDFLMIPDNGLLNSKTADLVNSVNPTYAAITCSDKNPASTDVLQILSSKGINTYLTTNGSIRITSNGSEITIEQ